MCVSLILLPWTASLGFSPQPHPSRSVGQRKRKVNPLFLSFKWSAEEGARSQGATRAMMQKSSWTPSPESLRTLCPQELWSVQKCPWPSVFLGLLNEPRAGHLCPNRPCFWPYFYIPKDVWMSDGTDGMTQELLESYHGGNMGLRIMKPGIWNCWPLHNDGWSNWTWLENLLFSLRFVPPLHLSPARTSTQGLWFSWPRPVIQINVCLHLWERNGVILLNIWVVSPRECPFESWNSGSSKP